MKLPAILRRRSTTCTVSELMQTDLALCSPGDSLSHAARLMWDRDCGMVPIVSDGGQAVGVITDRDICMAGFTQGRALADIPISAAMSSPAFCCGTDDELTRIYELMQLHQIRRVLVVDEGKLLLGVVSLSDLARNLAHPPGGRRCVTLIDFGRALAAISRSREPLGQFVK